MKKFVCLCLVFLLLIFFILFPQNALSASKQGLTLWFEQILPTLLPFSVLSYVVLRSNLFAGTSTRKHRKISNEEWYIILCGFLFGFPIGSKLTADLYREGRIPRKRAQYLCVFTNNLSPVFVVSVLHEILHLQVKLSFYLLLYGIPFLYGLVLLLRIASSEPHKQKNTASRFQITMQIVDAGIINGFETLIKICGYIMMFSILTKMLQSIPWNTAFIPLLMTGCMEVTNGIAMLGQSDIAFHYQYLLALFFLSLNGICGLFQTASVLSRTDLSMKDYCKHKLQIILLTLTGGILLLLTGRLS